MSETKKKYFWLWEAVLGAAMAGVCDV